MALRPPLTLDHRQLCALTDAHSREFKHTTLMYSWFYANCALCMRASASYLAGCKSHHFCTFWRLRARSGCDSTWSTTEPCYKSRHLSYELLIRRNSATLERKQCIHFYKPADTLLTTSGDSHEQSYLHMEGPCGRITVEQTNNLGHITLTNSSLKRIKKYFCLNILIKLIFF